MGRAAESCWVCRELSHFVPKKRPVTCDSGESCECFVVSRTTTKQLHYATYGHDSRYIYLEDYSQGDDIVRVSVEGRPLQRLESVKDVPRSSDPWASWLGLAPDDSPLLMRDESTQEIYALDLQMP
jgi:hypothetical protein